MLATWETNDLRYIPLNAMTHSHIMNCINILKAGGIHRQYCDNLNQQEWILIFKTELVRRARFSST